MPDPVHHPAPTIDQLSITILPRCSPSSTQPAPPTNRHGVPGLRTAPGPSSTRCGWSPRYGPVRVRWSGTDYRFHPPSATSSASAGRSHHDRYRPRPAHTARTRGLGAARTPIAGTRPRPGRHPVAPRLAHRPRERPRAGSVWSSTSTPAPRSSSTCRPHTLPHPTCGWPTERLTLESNHNRRIEGGARHQLGCPMRTRLAKPCHRCHYRHAFD
jgi:hypothetical protein